MIFGLKELRKKFGISQQQLADAVGVSQQSINKYENQGVEPDITVLIKIADYFSTSVDYLTGHNTEEHPTPAINEEEKSLINNYRKLNSSEKEIIRLVIKNHQK